MGAAHRHSYNAGYRDGTRDGKRAGEATGWEQGKAFGEYEANRKAEGEAAETEIASWRTSSAANAGADKDSEQRQRRAITGYAKRAGMVLVGEFNDPAVSGADPIETRPGFAALLDRIEGNGVRVVIVEDASRFARELMTQELGLVALIRRGVRVVTANGDDLTDTSDPSRVMMRQIAGSFHEYEKARLVAKLKAARDAKRAETGKCGGRQSYAERDPALVAVAKALRAERPRASLRKLAAALAEKGFVTPRGLAYSASAVQSMLGE